jgi:hypothetical protein
MSKKMSRKIFECGDCGYATGRKFNLDRHMAKHKLNPKIVVRHKCPTCTYSTDRKFNFDRHVEQHAKKKKKTKLTYRCAFCDYESTNKSNINKHVQNHKRKLVMRKCYLSGMISRLQGRVSKPVKRVCTDYKSALDDAIEELGVVLSNYRNYEQTEVKIKKIKVQLNNDDHSPDTCSVGLHQRCWQDYDYLDTDTNPEDKNQVYSRRLEVARIRGEINKTKRLIYHAEDDCSRNKYQRDLDRLVEQLI